MILRKMCCYKYLQTGQGLPPRKTKKEISKKRINDDCSYKNENKAKNENYKSKLNE